jgi:UDP-N-acetylmuramoyl-L-alanyl-D-glutamate--2,6-diaminopimelate ligase
MKLKVLTKNIRDITVKGLKEIDITGITANSKMVSPGNLFVAKRGAAFDGNSFIPEAIRSGAVAVLSDIYDPGIKEITQLIHPAPLEAEAALADAYFQSPSQELCMIGVTGTSGKTTTSYAIRHILEAAGARPGLIGTIEYIVGNNHYEAARTTPDVVTNHRLLREMVRQGCASCVMEVTSHALSQKRVAKIEYDIGVFMNLTPEHLDYHKTMEEYFQSKAQLFRTLSRNTESRKKETHKMALYNSDDPWSCRLEPYFTSDAMAFAIQDERAPLRASNITFSERGSQFHVHFDGECVPFSWPLVGRFNVYNALAAIGVGLSLGLSLADMATWLTTFQSAPGRLERVPNDLGLNIYVDYAHKVDALENVLKTLRECTRGKIITVFGCGGDRDREKRPMMGRIAEELSDLVIVTSDNPRSEDPESIIDAIAKGFQKPEAHIRESDRKKAIEQAIDSAGCDDIVLIAGKGHEKKQQLPHMIIDFDDRLVAKSYCDEKMVLRHL